VFLPLFHCLRSLLKCISQHSTLFLGPSLCVARWYRRYFVAGDVPLDKETYCANEVQLFPSEISADEGDEDPDFVSLVRQIQEVMGLYFPPGLP